MSVNTNKLIKYIQKLADPYGLSAPKNTPVQYKDKQHEYLNNRNRKFSQNRAYLANDYVIADVQGLNPDDFYEWRSVYVRFSDISQSSSMATRKTDDWKEVMFPQEEIDYFPIGALIETMGSTWINVNPSNMGSAYATAIMARCNASYNSYDYYGNIITEPLYVGSYQLNKTAPYVENYHINLMDGNILITCQYNENTKRLGETKRLILGSKVYYVSGYADYIQEFTGDRESTHLITFTARVDEPTDKDDMLETFVAGGKAESFGATIEAVNRVVKNSQRPAVQTITPMFIHNGAVVESTEEHPITWKFDSSDESIAIVLESGVVSFKTTGTVTVRATMKQNTNIHASVDIECVSAGQFENYVEFDEYKSTKIRQFESQTYVAHGYINGASVSVTWSLEGADTKDDYSYVVNANNSITITCNHASAAPLVLTATCGSVSQSINLILEGY